MWLLAATVIGAMVAWLALLGRPWGPEGALHLWNSDFGPTHNSQHLADGYSLLHLSFGALIWALLRRFNPALRGARLALTIAISAATWEAIENLPAVIEVFNQPRMAASYQGDSIVNALSDAAFASTGFATAMRLSWPAVWGIIGAIEVAAAALVGDGLLWGSARMIGIA